MNPVLHIGVAEFSRRFASDPELRLPDYPYFRAETFLIPYSSDRVLIEGAHHTQVLGGTLVPSLLYRLLPCLDGLRNTSSICEMLPDVSPSRIVDVLTLLYSRGLLEDGRPTPNSVTNDNLGAFLGRYTDVTRVNRNRQDALLRLHSMHTVIAGSGVFADLLFTSLKASGLQKLTRLTEQIITTPAPSLLILTSSDGDWYEWAHKHRITTFHVDATERELTLGPLFIPGMSACYQCFRSLWPINSNEGRDNLLDKWIGLASLNIFHIVTRIGAVHFYNRSISYTLDTELVRKELLMARMPGCKSCELEHYHALPDTRSKTLWVAHMSSMPPPRECLNPRDHQHHYDASNLALVRAMPAQFCGAKSVALPHDEDTTIEITVGAGTPPVNKRSLACVLQNAFGSQVLEDGIRRRIAPSAGGLGSAEAIVICRNVDSLERGVYHYDASKHELELLGLINEQQLCWALNINQLLLPDCIVIGVACLDKVAAKYLNASFRLAFSDAGVAVCILQRICISLGYSVIEYNDHNPELLGSLGCLPHVAQRYMITNVIGVSAGALPQPHIDIPESAQLFSRVLNEQKRNPRAMHVRYEADKGLEYVQTKRRDHAELKALLTLLRARRSLRVFSERTVSDELLASIVKDIVHFSRFRSRSGSLPVEMGVKIAIRSKTAWRINGAGEDGEIKALDDTSDITGEQLVNTGLQGSLTQAPCVIFIHGNFEAVAVDFHLQGYRELYSLAGSMATQALLSAGAKGIMGCIWGGIIESYCGKLLGLDRYGECPLLAVSLGYPKES